MTIGLDTLLLKSAKALAGLVVKTGWEMGNVRLDERVKQSIFSASKQYVQNYRDRHGILKVLGMQQPMLLESIYVAAQFLDGFGMTRFNSIEGLERAYREGKQRKFMMWGEPEKHSGLEIANQIQYLMVLGGPGVGKSTFLLKMGLEALKGKQNSGFQHQCMPVFIELKNFRSGEINIKAAIVSELKTCGFPDPEHITEQTLKQGKLLVLLDGLDEVPSYRTNDIITHIQDFVDRYSKNRFIASCRIAAYRHNFRRFTDIRIADFDDGQIEGFITNWFQGDLQRGQECWKKLSSQDYAATKELTHTPLLLTLVCLLYQRAGQFPTNRATLYERVSIHSFLVSNEARSLHACALRPIYSLCTLHRLRYRNRCNTQYLCLARAYRMGTFTPLAEPSFARRTQKTPRARSSLRMGCRTLCDFATTVR